MSFMTPEGRNPNWNIRINDLMRLVGQGAGAGRTMWRDGEDSSWRSAHPYWRTEEGRQWISQQALGNKSLPSIVNEMKQIQSTKGTRNMDVFNQALAIRDKVEARDPEALAAFKNGEYAHILNDKGHVHGTVGWQEGSEMFNTFLNQMRDEDRALMQQGYANQGWSFDTPNGMFNPPNNTPSNEPSSEPSQAPVQPRGLFSGFQNGIGRSGTWGAGHTQGMTGSDLRNLAQGAWNSIKPQAENWAQNNPEVYSQLQQTAQDFQNNPGMFGQNAQDMRQALITALENKLLG